jgi:hypothetical protein
MKARTGRNVTDRTGKAEQNTERQKRTGKTGQIYQAGETGRSQDRTIRKDRQKHERQNRTGRSVQTGII